MHSGVDTVGMTSDGTSAGLSLDMSDFLKARPVEDGVARYLYIEPSIPGWDQEKEKILKSALWWSVDHFIAKGNLDIEHLTAIGHRIPNIKNPYEWEVGVPLEARESPDGIFVKGSIAHDDGGKADFFWHSLTVRKPAQRWFPSVYGEPKEARKVFHEGEHRTVITKALWRGIGFAKEPMNLAVQAVTTTPFGAFAKSVLAAASMRTCTGDHCECEAAIAKTVTTGMGTPGGGTDVAQLAGGAALRRQSIDGGVSHLASSWQSKAARYVRRHGTDACEHTRGRSFERSTMQDHFERCEGMSPAEATRVTSHLRNRARDRFKRAA